MTTYEILRNAEIQVSRTHPVQFDGHHVVGLRLLDEDSGSHCFTIELSLADGTSVERSITKENSAAGSWWQLRRSAR